MLNPRGLRRTVPFTMQLRAIKTLIARCVQVVTSELVKKCVGVKKHYTELLSARDAAGKRRNFRGGRGIGKERLGMICSRVYVIGGQSDTVLFKFVISNCFPLYHAYCIYTVVAESSTITLTN